MSEQDTKKVKVYKPKKYKQDIIDSIIEHSKKDDIISHAQVKRLVNQVFDEIIKMTDAGNLVVITNFGSFEKVARAPREYVTPQGKHCSSSGSNRIVFKASESVIERNTDAE